MRAVFKIVNPDEVEATITVTATIKDWRALRGQLTNGAWPSWKFSSAITDAIRQAEAKFYGEPQDNQEQPNAAIRGEEPQA